MADKVFETINEKSSSELLLTCEHAEALVPSEYGTLGLEAEKFDTHIARDKGAREVTRLLAQKLSCRAVLGKYSRLLIDLNRRPNEQELIVEKSDGVPVPFNQNLRAEEKNRRLQDFYFPYYAEIERQEEDILKNGKKPLIFSVHSFTPQLQGGDYRPWNAGILWHRENPFAQFVHHELQSRADKNIGVNVPYDLRQYNTGAAVICGEEKGFEYALIEIRDDEFDNLEKGAEWWADKLSVIISEYLKRY